MFKNCAAVDSRRINGAYEFILDTCGRFSQGASGTVATAPHVLIAEADMLLSVAQFELRDGGLVQGLLSVRCWLQEMSDFLMEVRYIRLPALVAAVRIIAACADAKGSLQGEERSIADARMRREVKDVYSSVTPRGTLSDGGEDAAFSISTLLPYGHASPRPDGADELPAVRVGEVFANSQLRIAADTNNEAAYPTSW